MRRLTLFLIFISSLTFAQFPHYFVQPVKDSITIDGEISDWSSYPPSNRLLNHVSSDSLNNEVTFKLTYDSTFLYGCFIVKDSTIVSNQTQFDSEIFKTDDCVEVFLDFDGDGLNYLEFGISPIGTYYDILVECPLVKCSRFISYPNFNIKEPIIATKKQLNGYFVEFKISFQSLKKIKGAGFTSPQSGTQWKANFYNINQTPSTTFFNAWSPLKSFGFHQPSKFGTLTFK